MTSVVYQMIYEKMIAGVVETMVISASITKVAEDGLGDMAGAHTKGVIMKDVTTKVVGTVVEDMSVDTTATIGRVDGHTDSAHAAQNGGGTHHRRSVC